ncbi:hypothetical protein [Mesonia maritima]|uniref:Tfp pilus assembly protein PilN n=1 Tax=Mesonia maritima TaxID=1793873 RepID=A0ABU1K497_9FLAO|nr:hypothetical protein [Mesonia maritima]MDR6299398.1 Tfp pilus assembly protein PilN [Mesonia maritima]
MFLLNRLLFIDIEEMFVNFIHTYFVKEFYALHIHIGKERLFYNLVHLYKSKGTVKIKNQQEASSYEVLEKKINKKIPVVLSVTGTKIVSKKVLDQPNYLKEVLFDKDPDEFYIFEKQNEGNILVSVTRKGELDVLLTDLKEKKLQVIDTFIGPFILDVYDSLLKNIEIIETPYLNYHLETNNITIHKNDNFSPAPELEVGDEKIVGNCLIAFSGFMQYLNKTGCSTNYEAITRELHEEFTYGKAFKLFGGTVLGVFLTLLMVSYTITVIYAGKNAEIQQELTLKNQVSDQLIKLKKDKRYKENIIKNSSLGSANFISFYVADLMKTIPNDIVLEQLSVFPIEGNIDAKKKINIKPNQIVIKGLAPTNRSANNWLTIIEALTWVEKAEIYSYTYKNSNYFFTLNLFL